MRSKFQRIVLLTLIGVVLSTACEEDITGRNKRFAAEEPFDFEVERNTRTYLSLEAINGAIEITGASGGTSISVSGIRRVESDSFEDANAHLPLLEVGIDSTSAGVVVRTVQPAVSAGRDYIVNYTISLPEDFAVMVAGANGDVTTRSLKNGVTVQFANSKILGLGIEGNTVMAVANGQIDATVTLGFGESIALGVANGEISLKIPEDTSAEFSATAANGDITLKNLTLSNRVQTPTSVTGTLGNGDGTITLDVGNGNIGVDGF
ncbi:MAG: DUF4097 family beta strand repeat protein [Candidatus Latescibacterota bacterium]|nr:MAG: DUF4097 family beta strand repeat protein [Candidatus Latescibacterota bacterium]